VRFQFTNTHSGPHQEVQEAVPAVALACKEKEKHCTRFPGKVASAAQHERTPCVASCRWRRHKEQGGQDVEVLDPHDWACNALKAQARTTQDATVPTDRKGVTMNPSRIAEIAATDRVLDGEAAEMARILLQAHARRSDPSTSKEAAASVVNMTKNREAVLATFEQCGELTDFELVSAYGHDDGSMPDQSESGLRTRRAELVRMGKLRDSGKTRDNANGRRCVVWALA
jgi:hypothetical protein